MESTLSRGDRGDLILRLHIVDFGQVVWLIVAAKAAKSVIQMTRGSATVNLMYILDSNG